MKLIDLTGKRFGRLSVARYVGNQRWLCVCDCGTERIVNGADLRNGRTKSCGCFRRETVVAKNKKTATHGMKGTRIYRIWSGMKNRCYCPTAHEKENYSGRGITVCDEWKNSFEVFYKWSMENGYKEHLTIDRINNDGNYEPSNCRWATYKEQANNRRPRRRTNLDA